MDYILLKYQKVYPFNCSNVSYVQLADFFLAAPLTCAHTLRQKRASDSDKSNPSKSQESE